MKTSPRSFACCNLFAMSLKCPFCGKDVDVTKLPSMDDAVCPGCGGSLWLKPTIESSAVDMAFAGLGQSAPLLPGARPEPVRLTKEAGQIAAAYNTRGVALSNQGAYRQAVAEFNKALQHD